MKNNVSRETIFVKRGLAVLVTLVLLAGCLLSCGGVKYTEEEVKAALTELLPLSFELNDIYFGVGLPISDDRADVERFYATFDTDVKAVNYHPVSPEAPYQSEAEIRTATEKVFTQNYCQYLYEMAFSGISAVFDEGTDHQVTSTAAYARYLETNGILTVRLDLPYEAMPLGREYDIESAQIVQQVGETVIVTVPTVKDGVPLDVELKLVMTANGFRLDTPTY